MSGTKKLRKKLGKKVIAGKITVDEARARLGRQAAQDRRPKRDERICHGLEAAAAAVKSARPVTYQDLLDAARPITRPAVRKAAVPAPPREHPLQVLKALRSYQALTLPDARPARSWTPVDLAMLREIEKISDPTSREQARGALVNRVEGT